MTTHAQALHSDQLAQPAASLGVSDLSAALTELTQLRSLLQGQAAPLPDQTPSQRRLSLDPENVKRGLGQLVVTLVKLLHELLERQALRRIEAGSLTDKQIDDVGRTLLAQAREIDRLRREFGLEEADLNLDLGPLGKLL